MSRFSGSGGGARCTSRPAPSTRTLVFRVPLLADPLVCCSLAVVRQTCVLRPDKNHRTAGLSTVGAIDRARSFPRELAERLIPSRHDVAGGGPPLACRGSICRAAAIWLSLGKSRVAVDRSSMGAARSFRRRPGVRGVWATLDENVLDVPPCCCSAGCAPVVSTTEPLAKASSSACLNAR